ncbi:MAG: pyruvoyl-dependent arginine decarboxylase [Bacteroidales bacterium]
MTKGVGESDITIHAGSYHLALKAAGIERANIMTYSSILPGIANEIPQPHIYKHGEVMESIMAVATGNRGERVSAGIIYGWMKNRITGKRYGGLVYEHNGTYDLNELHRLLHASLDELYYNGFDEEFELLEPTIVSESFVPEKRFGTALVAICFVNYLYPVI